MKIIVLTKEVPDTYGERKLSLETGLADRASSEAVLDEINERALEAALSHSCAPEATEIVLLTMSPDGAETSLRRGLAMGADSAVHIADPSLAGADLLLTAETLAAAVRRIGFDLIIAGDASTDGAAGAVPAMLAELLQLPLASSLSHLEIAPTGIRATQTLDDAVLQLTGDFPAIVSVTEALPAPRFPNFKGIMSAKKKPIEVFTAAELDVDLSAHGTPRSIMTSVTERPGRAAGIRVIDEGNAGFELAEFLTARGLA